MVFIYINMWSSDDTASPHNYNNSPPTRNFRFVLPVQLLLEFFQDTDSVITEVSGCSYLTLK